VDITAACGAFENGPAMQTSTLSGWGQPLQLIGCKPFPLIQATAVYLDHLPPSLNRTCMMSRTTFFRPDSN
jgi:hypothetical protein